MLYFCIYLKVYRIYKIFDPNWAFLPAYHPRSFNYLDFMISIYCFPFFVIHHLWISISYCYSDFLAFYLINGLNSIYKNRERKHMCLGVQWYFNSLLLTFWLIGRQSICLLKKQPLSIYTEMWELSQPLTSQNYCFPCQ